MIKQLLTLSLLTICSFAIAQQKIAFPKFVDSVYVEAYREYVKGDKYYKVLDKAIESGTVLELFHSERKPKQNNIYDLERISKNEIYHADGSMKASQNYDSKGKLDGESIFYDNEGKIKTKTIYEQGIPIGKKETFEDGILSEEIYYNVKEETDSLIQYYSDGKRKAIELIIKAQTIDDEQKTIKVAHWLPDGKQIVWGGNGLFIEKDSLDRTVETGRYKNGFKEGIWKGTSFPSKTSYIEKYDDGLFIKGVSTDSLGNQTAYEESAEIQPVFIGGKRAMYNFLGSNINYPLLAQRGNISGKIYCKFVVEKNGEINDVKAIIGVHPELDKEAIRVINSMSKMWYPGYQNGRPVRVYYTMPISFKLQ